MVRDCRVPNCRVIKIIEVAVTEDCRFYVAVELLASLQSVRQSAVIRRCSRAECSTITMVPYVRKSKGVHRIVAVIYLFCLIRITEPCRPKDVSYDVVIGGEML